MTLIIAAATLLGLALRAYQLSRPGFMFGVTEYDDGVYFGGAVRLIDGAVPYRDFVLVHPPGIVLLMAPLALLAKATGTASAFAVARVVTALVGAASVPLAGLLVRHRGPVAAAVVCGLVAVYPAQITAAHTVLLEPWLILFCLLGALIAFDGDQVTDRPRRLVWAGVVFGLAATIKVWGALPLLVLAVVCWQARSRRHALRFLAGAIAGFAAAVAPFFALAPGAFYRDVLVAQLTRVNVARVPVWDRLQSLAALSANLPASHSATVAAFVLLCVLAVGFTAGAWARAHRAPPVLEWFAGLTTVLILIAFLVPPEYFPHYAAFFVPFLAISIGLPAARLFAAQSSSGGKPRGEALRIARIALAVATIALVGLLTAHQVRELNSLHFGDPAPFVHRQTAAGACVVSDIPAVTIEANRFASTTPGCSAMTDPLGTSYALARGRNGDTGAGRTPAVRAVWLSALHAAQYVWLQCPPWTQPQCLTSRRVPWTPSLRLYFSQHFRPVAGQGPVPNLFRRRAS